ncbi:MAG: hypothetical protein GPJ54_22665, partial [Candidatus Heimdallarchaeota archaeon]|nr:hypothetical protein [Candidatus Heimdallarchaeota archaeon]
MRKMRIINRNYLTLIALVIVILLNLSSILYISTESTRVHRSNDSNKSVTFPDSDYVPQTKEEADRLFDRLTTVSAEEEAEIRKNLKIPFTGFIENTGQKSNFLMKYYYSTDESYIHFEKSKIRFRQEIKDNLDQLNKPHYKKVENLVQDAKYLDFQISFVDANEVNPLAKYPLTHSTNYFTGKIHYTGISSYEEIWYHNIYDSIDLRYFMTDQGLKYEFIVHPGGNPADIAIQISETARLKVSNNRIGLYALDTNQYDEIIADTNLFVYETDTLIENEQNRSISIQSAFTLIDDKKQIYGYQISSYNPNNILVIDPLIMGYSALFGGNGLEQGNSIAVDGYGNVYITGYTYSTDFQTTMGAYNESINGADDVYVFKLNTAGNGLVYSTFLGGTGMDRANSITVDSTGDVYITGFTSNDTINFPTTPGAYNENHNGNWDVFVTKLNANGDMLIYSTFLGGNDNDAGLEIIIDSLGNAYLTGWTADDVIDFPITNGAYDELHNGNDDVFVCKLNNAGNVLVYSTFLGGSGTDRGSSITLDSLGNVYVTGTSMNSITDFPTTPGAFDETHNGGSFDVFVSKLNTDGEVLIYSTFLGGSGNDYSYGIEVDGFGNIYVAGRTISDTIDFPTTLGAYDRTHNGGTFDIFVSKLNSMGSGLIYSTYLGGNGGDEAWGMTIDDFSNVYITGHTYSINFPTTSGAYDETHNGEMDAFLSKFNTAGSGLVYSTFLGGSGSDQGKDIIVDSSGNVYITGVTTDDTIDFPTTNGVYDETHNGITDVFITKLHWKGYNTFLGGSSEDNSKSIAVDGSGNVYVTGQTLDSTTDFPTTSGAYDETYEAGRDAFIVKLNATGNGLVYSTFLGGNGQDYGQGIVIDSSGNVYVAGYTSSTNFPTTIGAYDETKSSNLDVFVTKLNANGDDLIYSTYLGEFSSEIANAIVVDSSGNAYVTGYTSSTDFPTTPGAYDETHNGVNDVFVFKLNSTGNGLVYSTFLGGSGSDYGNDITIDNSGNAYVTGRTDNDTIDFPTTSGAYDETHNGERDVFIFKLNTAGNGLVYSTFLGGSGIDQGNGITIDNSGNAYVTGSTLDGITDFPSTPGTYDEFHNDNDGQFDVFVSKLNAAGNGLVYSTFLGGSDSDEGQGIAIDSSGNVYVTGYTYSTNFPTSIEAFDETHNGVSDVFVAKLNATGNGLDYSTFLGGSGSDLGYSITVDSAGNVYITGRTYSVNFPTTNGPYDETYNGGAGDVFVFVNNLIIDTLEPNINKPEDLYYQLGQLGNTLMWDLVDLNPNYYNITLDGSILFSQIPWTNGLPSIVDVDGLSEGNHSVIITAVDKFGNTNSGLVYVIVDGYSPILTSPPNIYYKLGNTANTITWNLGDNNPDFYNITLDGIINVSDTSWTNGTVGINIDGLS